MTTTEPREPSRKTAQVWVTLYLVLLSVLVYGVFAGLRLRCEGFGCMGVGVYWFAWACVCGVTGLLGWWAQSCTRRAGVAVGLVRAALWVQLLGALALLAWWQWPR